jgi:hypothetical protein
MNTLLTSGALGILALATYVADSGPEQSGFTAFWTGILLLALAVTARSVLQSDFGAAVAWGYIAVFVSIAPLLLAFPLTNMAALWDSSACDPTGSCSPAGFPMWLPAVLYTAAFVFAWRAVRACKAESPETDASGKPPLRSPE